MATGFFAILDDVAALSKIVASSLDDVAAKAAKAGSKAAGIVVDDAAVTPRYVVGFASDRELPIIWRIALGSLKNKLLFLLPGALLLSFFAPILITPLLMAGGAYLCLEGFHKVLDLFHAHGAEGASKDAFADSAGAKAAEEAKIQSAIRTDFILSAEIMAIALAAVSDSVLWLQAIILGFVGVFMTGLVYGAVALIVKADDFGAYLVATGGGKRRWLGRWIVKGMPGFLRALSFIGMVAMLWVGGGIIIHGAHVFGLEAPEHWIGEAAHALAPALPVIGPILHWLVIACFGAAAGLAIGGVVAAAEAVAFTPLKAIFEKTAKGI